MPSLLAGISFPFRREGAGLPASAKGTDVIRSALIVLLRTGVVTRVMRPTIGTDLQSLLFESQGPLMRTLIQREILVAISNFLPQVEVTSLDFIEGDHAVQVNVKYVVQGVQDETGEVTIGRRG